MQLCQNTPCCARGLMADDEQALVDMNKQMLRHLGYEVVTRTSGTEALELFRA